MRKMLFCLCLLPLAGCAQKSPIPEATRPESFAAVTLGQAAESAHGELAMLAKLRGQGLKPLLPPSDPSLSQPVSIAWTGPAGGALKEICLQLGYRYQEMGAPSAQPLVVVVRGMNRPAHVLLEDIAWQVQPQAVVRVDPISRVITLARTSKEGERS